MRWRWGLRVLGAVALIDAIMIMLTTTTRKVTVIMIMLTMWTPEAWLSEFMNV